jgi:trimethylamine---corrinoid protein Co-methyltransferase
VNLSRADTEHFGVRRFSRLSWEQCERLHAATLSVLERTGVRLHEPEAVALLAKAGAPVSEGNRVRIPPKLVEWALSIVPRHVTMFDRHGRPAMDLGGYNNYFGPGSDCLNIIDHRTWERRKPVLHDVVEGVTLCDALPEIDFVMSMFLPENVNQQVADRYQMEAMLTHSTKPIVFVTPGFEGCADLVEMAEAVAGGADALRQKPTIICYVNVVRGLVQNEDSLQKVLFMAEKGLPFITSPGSWCGVSGPVTMAGAQVVANAGVLTDVVLAQLKREGTPMIFKGTGGGVFDMRTMVIPYAAPDRPGWGDAMCHFYDVPMWSLAGASDSKLVDQQAGIEAALMTLTHALIGGHLIHDLGYLESGMSGSLAQVAICTEIVSWVKHLLAEPDVDDESLALDLIDELGPDGDFLGADHTRRHHRERWYPKLFDRDTYDGWAAHGARSLGERAADRVNELLARHQPEPLPPDVAAAVHAIVERAEAR